SGGASFIVRNDSGINSVKDLGGKKFASPELGNTQDISLRKYIVKNGFNTIVRTDYLKENPDVIKKLLEANVDETLWINKNKEKALNEFNVELKKLTGK